MVATALSRVFMEVELGRVRLRNRVAASGLGWNWAGLGPAATSPGPAVAAFWGARAAAGMGLLISEPQSVHPTGTASPMWVENADDAIIERYRPVTDAVHQHGGTIVAHLNHVGNLGNGGFRNLPLWAPSPVRAPAGAIFPRGGGVIPHEMTAREVAEAVESFAAAAGRAIAAGFDGVEVNAGEGGLIAQFLSPFTNRRGDEYGGSDDARRRFLLEVVRAVRERIGAGPLLGVRIGSDVHLEGGLGVEDVRAAARALADAGAVDYLHTTPSILPNAGHEPGAYSDLAVAARESGLPVIYTGWADSLETAESLLEDGVCDVVNMPRATLADVQLLEKARKGRSDEIRPCIACNEACTTNGLLCTIGAGVSANGAGPALDDQTSLRVLVVGAGPAGMSAASLLAHRGHDVTVWEREERTGGQVAVAAAAPARGRLAALTEYLEAELRRSPAQLVLGREAGKEDVAEFAPDAVVVAAGGGPYVPDLPGVDQPSVYDVRSVLRGDVRPSGRIVVVIARGDHRYQGLTTAEFLAERGCEVHVVTDAHYAGDQWEPGTLLDTYRRLAGHGVEFTPMTELVAVREYEVHLRNYYSHEPSVLEADGVVLSFGDSAGGRLARDLESLGLPVHLIGDAYAPRDIEAALRDAAQVAERVAGR